MADYLDYHGNPITGNQRATLLFAFASVAYAVVAKDIFPAIYATASDLAPAVFGEPGFWQTISSTLLLLEYQPHVDRAALAVLFLLVWGFYFWTIIGVRSTTGGRYSARQLTFDMAHAVCLYCAASSLHADSPGEHRVSSFSWLALLMLSLMYHIRFLHGLFWCRLPDATRLSVAGKSARRWVLESMPAAHLNCVAAAFATYGFLGTLAESDGRSMFNSLFFACLAYVIMSAATVLVLRHRERDTRTKGQHEFWRRTHSETMLGFLVAVGVVLAVEIALAVYPGWTHNKLLEWRNQIPSAAVLLLLILASATTRFARKHLGTRWSRRKDSLDETLPHFFDQAVEQFGGQSLMIGTAGLSRDGRVTDLTVCSYYDQAATVANDILRAIAGAPRTFDALASAAVISGGDAATSRGVSFPGNPGVSQTPFALGGAKVQASEHVVWVGFIALGDAAEKDSLSASDEVADFVLDLAEHAAQMRRRQLARSQFQAEQGSVGTLRSA